MAATVILIHQSQWIHENIKSCTLFLALRLYIQILAGDGFVNATGVPAYDIKTLNGLDLKTHDASPYTGNVIFKFTKIYLNLLNNKIGLKINCFGVGP